MRGQTTPPSIRIEPGDITQTVVDVIVNAASSGLAGGGGVDGAIHRVGGPQILEECRKLRATTHPRGLQPGEAVATSAGNLPARWVIHAVGPIYSESEDRSEILASAYREALRIAEGLGARTIAFPLLSAGAFGWPVGDAARIAVDTITSSGTTMDVCVVPFDAKATKSVERALGRHRAG